MADASNRRRLLITAALPSANGPMHLGHMLEFIQTDIWTRFQRLRGHDVVWAWADDTHGTAVMIRARQEGRSEEELIADVAADHRRDFDDFALSYDNYGSTHSDESRHHCHLIWQRLVDAGLTERRDVTQLFDPDAGTFLADRFVRGTCPNCGAADQYGDNCEKCGATYSPAELIDPVSTLSGATPVEKTAPHLYVRIEELHDWLAEWTRSGTLQDEVANYIHGQFLDKDLKAWDVSRPAPYFGFEIPDSPGDYWYVWFDAPIGYIGSTQQWCDANGQSIDDWWSPEASCEIHHFIGKDIVYFHTLFWPAMLKTAAYKLPTQVHVHGFLTVDGEKMSKARGTFVLARTYLNHLDPSYLRYYYASKLNNGTGDVDLDLDDFRLKVDSDLVGKVVNIASRCAKFVQKDMLAPEYPNDGGLFAAGATAGEAIAAAYEAGDFAAAMRQVMLLADAANEYVAERQPWVLRKDPDKADEVKAISTVGLNLFRQIAIYLAPVLPDLREKTERLLGETITHWSQSQEPLVGTPVAKFKHLLQRVDPEKVQAMIEDSKETAGLVGGAETEPAVADAPSHSGPLKDEPLVEGTITIDDLMKVDLRVAKVVAADHVEGADKLLQLTLSLGDDVTRNVFAGLKAAYEPESLVGKHVVMVANLKPRKMKFGLSEGMVMASGPGGAEVFVIGPDEGAQAGQRVH